MADDDAPVAVAFSGGGDSLALLLACKAWADANGRRIVALTVDHGLRPESAGWTRWCGDRARRLGVDHRALMWRGPKPSTGLSAAAREARHALLADAARAAGARVLVMGHTADDVFEAALMREAGSTVPAPRVWSPSPAWPEGRGVFVLRPLLRARRADIRAALSAAGESWIDDPSNADPSSLRVQARARVSSETAATHCEVPTPTDLPEMAEGPAGDLTLPRGAFAEGPGAARLLAAALLSASGRRRPPRGEAVRRLLTRIQAEPRVRATLGGARLHAEGEVVRLVRDITDDRAETHVDINLQVGDAAVWDGRFEIRAGTAPARVRALAGNMGRLPPDLLARARAAPAAVRSAIPVVETEDGRLALPTLAPEGDVEAICLTRARLTAALGGIAGEADLRAASAKTLLGQDSKPGTIMAHGENRRRTLNGEIEPDEACL